MPDTPEDLIEELRLYADLNTYDLEGLDKRDTNEWAAADVIEVAVRALREIRDGAKDPRTVARVALMSMGEKPQSSGSTGSQ